ncbi:beta-1,4-glucuronyltransferase 1 [Ischnura elegans]|uniref:beta-1,4-glucuronyltransferase 1 n=1 Tax=Ischnura elegans TaxID=197161 RepID=UPI001ED87CD1|nr:beta-1,4-glucuronyltransferase 1 [Ischnura elegans]
MGCRLWNLSMLSVLILTFSNILLTIRLLHSSDCPRPSMPGPSLTKQSSSEDAEGGGPISNSPSKSMEASEGAETQSVRFQQREQPVPPPPAPQPGTSTGGAAPSFDVKSSSATSVAATTINVPPATTTTAPVTAANLPPAPYTTEFRMDLNYGRWDNRRLFKMFDFVVVGEQFANLSARFSVCLATQSSLERLHTLAQVAHQWSGPISAAVFAAADEFPLVRSYIRFLRRCYSQVRERVSFHMAFPGERPPTKRRKVGEMTNVGDATPWDPLDDDDSGLPKLDCRNPEASLEDLLRLRRPETVRWRTKFSYPQNHMRNQARKACQSPYVFLTDVDVIPSTELAEKLDDFLVARPGVGGGPGHQGANGACRGLCAFVIPTYELDERVRFPQNKTDLVRLAKKGLARPFHQKVFIFNQFATNFSRWQDEPESPGGFVHVSHNVTNFEFLYEPFYVAADSVPPHDERFMGYGYTRNTQAYEMFVAGYQFQVLSPIFTCHWGLQNKRGRPPWRERQNSQNRKHFETFKREVSARYNRDPLHMLGPSKKQ